jgi:hypothetical protein
LRVFKAKDKQHFKFSKLVLNMATTFISVGGEAGVWASDAAALGGGRAQKVEQVGMVFQLFRKRNCVRFYGKVQKEIEAWLGELKAERRENDEVFQTKEVVCVALRRNSRRCWSPELHLQFIAALSQRGDPQGEERCSIFCR